MPNSPNSGLIETRLRVVTWNIWWRFGPWEQRAPAIAATLKALDPDIIALQEVWDDGTDNAAALLAQELGYHYVYVRGADLSGINMGNAILSRWPILRSERRTLYGAPDADEKRAVIYAEIDGPRGPIPIFTTHLNHLQFHSHIRQKQVTDIAQFIAAQGKQRFPPVLCGDFNADPHSDEIRMLTGQTSVPVAGLVFHDAFDFCNPGVSGYTWDNTNPYVAQVMEPDRRIDYIFTGWHKGRGAGHVTDCRIVGNTAVAGTDGDVWASDHHALLAELRY